MSGPFTAVIKVACEAIRAANILFITPWRYIKGCFATYKHLAAKNEKGIIFYSSKIFLSIYNKI